MAFPANVRVPRPAVIGQFSDEANRVSSGNVTVRDVNSINVKAFTCSDCSESGIRSPGSCFFVYPRTVYTFTLLLPFLPPEFTAVTASVTHTGLCTKEQVASVADEPARRAAARQACCKERCDKLATELS